MGIKKDPSLSLNTAAESGLTLSESGRRLYVDDDPNDSHVDRMKRALDWQIYNQYLEKHSEFKKPYYSESYPHMEYSYSPIFVDPANPYDPWYAGPTTDVTGGTTIRIPGLNPIVHPGSIPIYFWKVCMPGCHSDNPDEIKQSTTAWVKFIGFCPSIFSVSATMTGDEANEYTISEIKHFEDEGGDSVWGAKVTASASANGDASVKFRIRRYGFIATQSGIAEDPNDIITHILECDISTECCPGNLVFDDASTADTIVKDSSISVYITDGCAPFDWEVSEKGYSLDEAQTTARVNTLNCVDGICGSDYAVYAIVSITDACGDTVTATIRNTTGHWTARQDQLSQPWTTNYCGFAGYPYCTGCSTGYSDPLATYDEIHANYKFRLFRLTCLVSFQPYCGGAGDCPNTIEWKNLAGNTPAVIPYAGSPAACHAAYHGGSCSTNNPDCYSPLKGCIYRYADQYEWVC